MNPPKDQEFDLRAENYKQGGAEETERFWRARLGDLIGSAGR